MVILYSDGKEGWFSEEGYFLFENPIFKITYHKNRLILNGKVIKTSRPLDLVQKFIEKRRLYVVGYISYDFKDYTMPNIKTKPKKGNLGLPLLYLKFYKSYKKIPLKYQRNFTNIKNLIYQTEKDNFIEKVERAKSFIESGDVYQINLSHRIEVEGIFNYISIFQRLTRFQPTPYMMYIRDRDFRLISGSMELFLRKDGDRITTKPIKGTCDRRRDFREFLLNSEKEKAENLMITDLMRNDLGRICRDVRVERLFEVQEYKTLYQMCSIVSGTVNKGISFRDVIVSTFPPGSVTGAPKKRAVEIIDLLEDVKRSVYCGATFLIKPNSDFIMSVAIRQDIFKNGRCYIYVGSGVVSDSDPVREYEETILKAEANLKALTL